MLQIRMLAGLALVLAMSGFASAQEDRIRSEQGGIYQSPAWGFGSVTGAPNDVITIKNSNGNPKYQMTVTQWVNSVWIPENYPIAGVTYNSGGQITIRFNYARLTALNPGLVGGTVEVSGVAVDTDRLY